MTQSAADTVPRTTREGVHKAALVYMNEQREGFVHAVDALWLDTMLDLYAWALDRAGLPWRRGAFM